MRHPSTRHGAAAGHHSGRRGSSSRNLRLLQPCCRFHETLLRSNIRGRLAVLVKRVKLRPKLKQQRAYIVVTTVSGAMKRRRMPVVPHVDARGRLEKQPAHLGVPVARAPMKGRPLAAVRRVWVRAVLQQRMGRRRVAVRGGLVQWRFQVRVGGRHGLGLHGGDTPHRLSVTFGGSTEHDCRDIDIERLHPASPPSRRLHALER